METIYCSILLNHIQELKKSGITISASSRVHSLLKNNTVLPEEFINKPVFHLTYSDGYKLYFSAVQLMQVVEIKWY